MANKTVLDLIRSAYRLLNVNAIGDQLPADMANEGLDILNSMIDNWNTNKYYTYKIITELLQLVPGKNVYTIGNDPSADFITTRPTKIETAFTRDSTIPQPVDWQLEIITNKQFQTIPLKTINITYPYYLMYVPDYPVATITLYPTPTKVLSLGLSKWQLIDQFGSLNDTIKLPPGYWMCLKYSLALELAPQFGKAAGPGSELYDRARHLQADIKRLNDFEPRLMSCDAALIQTNRNAVNFFQGF